MIQVTGGRLSPAGPREEQPHEATLHILREVHEGGHGRRGQWPFVRSRILSGQKYEGLAS